MKTDAKSKQAPFRGKLLLHAAVICSSLAFALWPTPAGNLDAPAEPETSIDRMHVSIIIGDEDRKREAEFAAANGLPLELVRKATEATGLITCSGGQATAQVTGAPHVLSTAAHVFVNLKTCEPDPWRGCVFHTLHRPEKTYRVVADSVRTGDCSPGLTGSFFDWAVLRLESPVEDVEPLRLPPPKTNPDPDLLTIAAVAENFEYAAVSAAILEVCRIVLYNGVLAKTDCDAGYGSSGSAQLNLGTLGLAAALKKKEIGAINVAQAVDEDGKPVDGDEFHHDRWNLSVPVKGNFRKALVEAMAVPTAASKAR